MKLLILIFSSSALMASENPRCFYKHLDDAIRLNKERKELYSELTHGRSRKISDLLIGWEKLMTPVAKLFDYKARSHQMINIPFMCEDFIEMKEAPLFTGYSAQIPSRYQIEYEPISYKIKEILRLKLGLGYTHLKKQLVIETAKLKKNSSYDCLLRHLLESLSRTTDLAPRYLQGLVPSEARKLDKLIKKYLRVQIFGIGQAIFIDRQARDLQAQGLTILCKDVPHVPLSTWE